MLAGAFQETKAWFDVLLSIPYQNFPALPFPIWCQMAHCLVSLYRLSVLDEPPWDRRAVRAELDILTLCDNLESRFSAITSQRRFGNALTPEQAKGDIFAKTSRMLLSLRAGWESDLAGPVVNNAADGPEESAAGSSVDFVDNVTTGPMAIPMRFPDDTWVADNTWITDIFNVSWE